MVKRIRKLWSDKDETVFIHLWQKNLPDLQSERKNIDVYKEMVVQLQAYDVTVTPCEIKAKMEALKRKYCQEKNKIGSSDVCDWKHFKRVESLVGASCTQRSTYPVEESSDSDSSDCNAKVSKPITSTCEPVKTVSDPLTTESSASQTDHSVNRFRKPGKMWSSKEENALIYLWQENLPDLRGKRQKKEVYREMVEQLQEYDVTATPCEIKSKMEALKRKYSLEKTKVGSSDACDWKHFKIMESLVDCAQRSANNNFDTDSDSTACDPITTVSDRVTKVAKPITSACEPVKTVSDPLKTESSASKTHHTVSRFRKPGKMWSSKEENALIYLWQENLPDLRSERKNMDVYREMVEQLQEYDVTATPCEIKGKMEALKRKYCLEKTKVGSSDACDWKHFKIMESLVDCAQRSANDNFDTDSDSKACDPITAVSDRVTKVAKPITTACDQLKSESSASQTNHSVSKFRKPGKMWSPKEENALIYLWQANLPVLRSERKNMEVYREMVEQLLKYNVTATPCEIKSKMEALKRKYCLEKTKMGSSDVCDWKHFKRMEFLVGASSDQRSAKDNFGPDSDSLACDPITAVYDPLTSESSASQTDHAANKHRKPTKMWSTKEENSLIDLWQENLSEFQGGRKKKDIYKEMVAQLRAQDIAVTPREIKSKMEAMKKKYSKEKVTVERCGVSHWLNFGKMHSLCATSKAEDFEYSLEESSTCDNFDTPACDPDTKVDVNGFTVDTPSATVCQPNSSNDIRTDSSATKAEHAATVAYIKTLLCSLPFNVAEQLAFDFIAKCQEEILKHSRRAD